MLSLTELIDKYLMGELTGQTLIDFETRLKTDPKLQKEVDLQKMILKGIELASVSKQINTAQKNYWLKSMFIKVVIGLLLAAGIGTLTYLATKKTQDITPTEVIQKEQQFMIKVNQDTLLETKNGMVFIIPANAFETESDSVEIKIEEALDAASIMMKGLTTVSDSLLLETAGMFKFDANVKGNKVNIIKEITASLPTNKVDKDMMLFSGKEDSKGHINWVNPQKLQQELVTYDIEKLNFFPKGYLEIIDTLYQIKGINEESKRIYFEMSGYCGFAFHSIKKPIETTQQIEVVDKEIFQRLKQKAIENSSTKSDTFIPTVKTEKSSNNVSYGCEIDPSRIHAIWNKKFNKTILATKEFEERLQFIFTTCNPNFINYYINNLDKPIYFIDSLCASITNGSQREKFIEFYNRKDGGVNINDKSIAKLHQYYQLKYETYKTATSKTWKDYFDKNKKADQQFAEKSQQKNIEESARNSQVFREELCKNLTNAYSQIGRSYTCNKTFSNYSYEIIPNGKAYTFQITNTGWYNLDKYVYDATVQRKTLDYTDPVSGKRAVIIYSKSSIDIKNVDGYDFVNVYLLPNELSSYQKMRKEGNLFTENLNMSFDNKVVIVAKKGKDWYWNSIPKVEGKYYNIELKSINEFQLKKALNGFNESKKSDIIDDMVYNEYVEEYQQALNKRELLAEQKRKIAKVIFPCNIQDNSMLANPVPGTPAPMK